MDTHISQLPDRTRRPSAHEAPQSVAGPCDRCPAAAAVRVQLPSGALLMLCGHHARRHAPALLVQGAVITGELTLVAPSLSRSGQDQGDAAARGRPLTDDLSARDPGAHQHVVASLDAVLPLARAACPLCVAISLTLDPDDQSVTIATTRRLTRASRSDCPRGPARCSPAAAS
jgi:hypothetical protein